LTLVRSTELHFFMAMGAMLSLLFCLMMFICESCAMEGCVNEIKGTYDENQDPMLAIDWEITREELIKLVRA